MKKIEKEINVLVVVIVYRLFQFEKKKEMNIHFCVRF